MQNKSTLIALTAVLLVTEMALRMHEKAVRPVIAYDQRQVQPGGKHIPKAVLKRAEKKKGLKERKDIVEINKAAYEKALKDYGAYHYITKLAKTRYEDSQKITKKARASLTKPATHRDRLDRHETNT
jgi:hypothetical protein